MQQWCASLAAELKKWASVHSRSFFGMAGYYRGEMIFACLPEKRAFFSPYSIIFKLQSAPETLMRRMAHDQRINMSGSIGQKWFGYELRTMQDVRDSILWLETAYQNARVKPAQKAKPAKTQPAAGKSNPRAAVKKSALKAKKRSASK